MWKKNLCLLIFFLACIGFANAEISYSGLLSYYNLGDSIRTDITLSSDKNFVGFFGSSITCEGFESNFYTTPYKLTANQVSKISMPELEVFNYMKGMCSITWRLIDRDNKIVDEKTSPKFNVSDSLIIDITNFKKTLLPSEDITIKGRMQNIRGEETFGTMELYINGESKEYDIRAGIIDTSFKIPSTIKSGTNTLSMIFYDPKGNKYTTQYELQITPLATKIKVEIDNRSYQPYETLSGTVRLLDQADADMDSVLQISLKRTDSEDKNDVEAVILQDTHPGVINAYIDNLYLPGKYELTASFNAIIGKAEFDIEELSKVQYTIEGNTVIVKNIGNVKYKNQENIDASSQKFNKNIEDDVELRPGESRSIDLSKELKSGEYSIILPNGERTDSVIVNDNRGILTKTSDGISSITGFASKDIQKSFGSLSVAILVILVVLGLGLYAKKALYDKDDEDEEEENKNGQDEDIDVGYMLDGTKPAKPIKKKNTVDVFGAKDSQDAEAQEDIIPAKAENKILRQKLEQLERDNAELKGKVQMMERVNRMTQQTPSRQSSQQFRR